MNVKAEVESSNTVGYQKVNISSGLTMLGSSFVAVGGQEDLDIQDLVPSNTKTSGGVDYIRIWTGSGYTDYSYYSEAADGGIYDGDDCLGPGWGDSSQDAANEILTTGKGFWVHSNSAETIKTFGEVTENTEVRISAGLTMVCNPQPVDIDIQQIVPSNTKTSGGVDYIRIWTGSGYTDYSYYSEAADGGIYDGDDCLGPGWGDSSQDAVTENIPAGTAVWIHSNSAETLTFPNALAQP